MLLTRLITFACLMATCTAASALDLTVDDTVLPVMLKPSQDNRSLSRQTAAQPVQFESTAAKDFDLLGTLSLKPEKNLTPVAGWTLAPKVHMFGKDEFVGCRESVSLAERKIKDSIRNKASFDQTLEALGIDEYQIDFVARFNF